MAPPHSYDFNGDSDHAAEDTQLIDSPPSSPNAPSDANDPRVMDHSCGTQEVVDDETQEVTLDGETQVVILGAQTQEVDLAGETEVVDVPDGANIRFSGDLSDEVVADTDDEGTNITEIFDDADQHWDDGSGRSRGDSSLCGEGKVNRTGICVNEVGPQVSTATTVDQDTPIRKPARFTSVRTAAFRASGLAAHSIPQEGGNNLVTCGAPQEGASREPCSNFTNCNSSGQGTVENFSLERSAGEEVDQLLVGRMCSDRMTGLRNGSKAVRKLFTGDLPSASGEIPYNCQIGGGCELSLTMSCDDEISGLSYVNSQEPGEASQADALNFVQSLINDLSPEIKNEISAKKSPQAPYLKGLHSLAKKIGSRNIAGEENPFAWDDNLEDEGGGDILRRRRDELFGNESHSRKFLQKPKVWRAGRSRKNEELADVTCKILKHSDSTTAPHMFGENEKNIHAPHSGAEKNLGAEVEWMLDENASTAQLKESGERADVYEAADVGIDTQIAAEAMEALHHGEDIPCHGANRNDEDVPNPQGISFEGYELSSEQGKCVSDRKVGPRRSRKAKREGAKSGEYELRTRSKARPSSESRERRDGTPVIISGKKRKGVLTVGQPDESKRSNRCFIDRKQLKAWISNSLPARKPTHGSLLGPVPQQRRYSLRGYNAQDACGKGQMKKVMRTTLEGVSTADECFEAAQELNVNGKLGKLSHQTILQEDSLPPLVTDAVSEMPSCRKRRSSRTRNIADMNQRAIVADVRANKVIKHFEKDPSGDAFSSYLEKEQERTSREKEKPLASAFSTPNNFKTHENAVSPVCVGDDYSRLSDKSLARSGLMKEIRSLTATTTGPFIEKRCFRKRRDLATVRVLFSHHLDEDLSKKQKKILARLGVSEASSILDATHFVADKFVRTRNMLEAIASGKPIVTPLWLQSIGQAKIYIDEESYILRDTKKEKELGFSMPVSLSRARKHPLLQGKRVFITPNAKPGIETISSLVKAVHGQAVGRVGRSAMRDDKVSDDLLVLSCEEDYSISVPFLEKGAGVYSSELLLNGIVTQKLEYERYLLFADHVKKTRSTTWLRKDDGRFCPVSRKM